MRRRWQDKGTHATERAWSLNTKLVHLKNKRGQKSQYMSLYGSTLILATIRIVGVSKPVCAAHTAWTKLKRSVGKRYEKAVVLVGEEENLEWNVDRDKKDCMRDENVVPESPPEHC